MKVGCELVIGLPRARVVALFDDPGNRVKWQPELLTFEPLEGIPGQPGARARLVYRLRGRELELIETVTRREPPERFDGTYRTRGLLNRVDNRFVDEGSSTRWIVESEYRFDGALALLAPFMRGTLRRRTEQRMHQFKTFAEAQG